VPESELEEMPSTVRKSVIVAHPCETMFDLVEACERYPEFLPWCSDAEVFERDEDHTRARLDIDYHGLKSHIETLNRKERPRAIDLDFVEGPFEHFRGRWKFEALGEDGCRVELSLDYAFANPALEKFLGPVFGHIMETLVDRFVSRADAMAGPGA
jgi:ribosome-associated toxin RatA of RatAB toxin-antitoxin module